MTSKYQPSKIEKKWQKFWKEKKLFAAKNFDTKKKKFYHLVMFPYPSGDLHVGHWFNFAPADTYARFKYLQGYNVLSPIGFDAFGLPAENAAIKRKLHPNKWTQANINQMTKQLESMGPMYDWSRMISTSDTAYYKWTQWLFLQIYKKGLAYKKKQPANWCPSCQTVLANEQVMASECGRCGSKIEIREIEQWLFKITEYADRLLNDLDKLDWPQKTKVMQKNWIGRSEGTEIEFQVKNTASVIKVFTTRPDTIFGATYLVLAPEHPILENSKFKIQNSKEVENYIKQAKSKTELERKAGEREKTGVFTGNYVINPATGKEIPIWVADYVLMGYGTGAIMAVPAHDKRDWEFAKKFSLPITQVIRPSYGKSDSKAIARRTIGGYVRRKSDGKFLILKSEKYNWHVPIIGGIENNESPQEAAIREVHEETGLKAKVIKKIGGEIESYFYAEHKNEWRHRIDQPVLLEVDNDSGAKPNELDYQILWLTPAEAIQKISYENNRLPILWLLSGNEAYEGEGTMVSSSQFNGLPSSKAREQITDWLTENELTHQVVNYRLHDWAVSRQRYWGAPIPIIYCEKCGIVPVPEGQLPVELPDTDDYLPKGKPPLATAEDWVNVKCPKCGGPAKRETETMDTFVDSSWYFLRYPDPHNDQEFCDRKLIDYWCPVDIYIGGAEHTVLHLLYARFFTKILYDLRYIAFDEPFPKLRHQGIILGPDRHKMSKSRGNVIDPDKLVEQFGSDCVRMYLMFMGPYNQGGPWNPEGIRGIRRFVDRVWQLAHLVKDYSSFDTEQQIWPVIHKTIDSVTKDLEALHFNTAIAVMMELLNSIETLGCTKQQFFIFVQLLSPFAPHLSEELWQFSGNQPSIFQTSWPKTDPKYLLEENVTIAVSFNGKTRGTILVKLDATQAEVERLVQGNERLASYIQNREIRRIIYIPSKIINFVVE